MDIVIESIAHGGIGIGKMNGKVVFVDGVLPDEIVRIRTVEDKKDYFVAKAVEIVKPSEFRVVPKCRYYGTCGGCDFQHISYNYQLQLKGYVLKSVLKRIAGIQINEIDIVASADAFSYRKRMKFRCSNGKWGFFEKRSNNIIDIDECLIADKNINSYIKNNSCENREINMDDNGAINSNIMILDLSDIQSGLYLTYKPGAFIQVNKFINTEIIETVLDEVIKENIGEVFDFYGGIGNFSIPLAVNGVKVTNVDISKQAIDSFKKNVRRLNIGSMAFAVRKDLNKPFVFNKQYAKCLILDPPRAGAKSVVNYITKNRPEFVIYVSCEPSTLARDLSILKSFYIIEKIKLFDMFPQTHHFETFVKLKRKKDI